MQELPPAIIQFTDAQKRILKIVDKLGPDCVPGHIIKTLARLPKGESIEAHTGPLIAAGLLRRCPDGFSLI
jgi:hypothetical protein